MGSHRVAAGNGVVLNILGAVYELLVINRIARSFQSRRVLEIGTYDGRTTLNLAAPPVIVRVERD